MFFVSSLQLCSAYGINIPWSSGPYTQSDNLCAIGLRSYLYMLMLYDCYDVAARPISVFSYRLYVLLSVASMLKGYTPAAC